MTEQMAQSGIAARQAAMKVFACASRAELAEGLDTIGGDHGASMLRGPETGLVMIRGRTGGGGNAFNLGEASVTRASVRIHTGETGHSCVLGRDGEKARLCAILDALWQQPQMRQAVEGEVMAPICERLATQERERCEKVAATRVDFFTMVRGDD